MVVESVALRLIGCRVTLHLQPTSHFDASLIIFFSNTHTHSYFTITNVWLISPPRGPDHISPNETSRENHKVETFGLNHGSVFRFPSVFPLFLIYPPLPLIYIPGCFCPFVSFTPFILLHPPDGQGSCKYLIQAKASSSLRPYTPHLRHLITALLHTYFTA